MTLVRVARPFEARGVRAPYMTLADLRRTRHTPLADTIEGYYPGAFSGTEGWRQPGPKYGVAAGPERV